MAVELDRVSGYAIDGTGTKCPHQIADLSYDQELKLYTLHFSVFCPDTPFDAKQLTDEYFIPSGKDEYDRHIAPDLYGDFIAFMRPTWNQAFLLNVPNKAVTYDLTFDPTKKGLIDFGIRPTIATMTDKFTLAEAEKEARKPVHFNEDFVVWNAFARKYVKHRYNKKEYDFMRTLSVTTDLIRSETYKKAHNDNVDCLFMIRRPEGEFDVNKYSKLEEFRADKKLITEYFYHGSTLQYKETAEHVTPIKEAFIPATASRKGIDAYNIQLLFNAYQQEYEVMFPKGVTSALAEYKMGIFNKRVERALNIAA